jgi:hypothetical protein
MANLFDTIKDKAWSDPGFAIAYALLEVASELSSIDMAIRHLDDEGALAKAVDGLSDNVGVSIVSAGEEIARALLMGKHPAEGED